MAFPAGLRAGQATDLAVENNLNTVLVKDIWPGPNRSVNSVQLFFGSTRTLIFKARSGEDEWGFWRSDGTGAGTVRLLVSGFRPEHRVLSGDKLFFSGLGPAGCLLWKSDATEPGTTIVTNLPEILSLIAVEGGVRFSTLRGALPGAIAELWRSDGTEAGTVRFHKHSGGWVTFLAAGDGMSFFAAEEANGTFLWRTDGTESGTVRVAQLQIGFLYFWGVFETGVELCRSDGTEAGTRRITTLRGGGETLPPFAIMNGNLYFPGVIRDALPDSGVELIRVRVMPQLEKFSISGSEVSGDIFGAVGKRHVIQASPDLREWQEVVTVTNTAATTGFRVSAGAGPQRFFRAVAP